MQVWSSTNSDPPELIEMVRDKLLHLVWCNTLILNFSILLINLIGFIQFSKVYCVRLAFNLILFHKKLKFCLRLNFLLLHHAGVFILFACVHKVVEFK